MRNRLKTPLQLFVFCTHRWIDFACGDSLRANIHINKLRFFSVSANVNVSFDAVAMVRRRMVRLQSKGIIQMCQY